MRASLDSSALPEERNDCICKIASPLETHSSLLSDNFECPLDRSGWELFWDGLGYFFPFNQMRRECLDGGEGMLRYKGSNGNKFD